MQTTPIVNQMISFPTSLQSLQLSRPTKALRNGRGRAPTSILAMRSDGGRDRKRRDYKLVDENMVVLKMRIQEMEMKERESRASNPEREEWYEDYDCDVYEMVGLLQMLMMNNRPSLVLGVVALLLFTSSTSLLVVFSSFLGLSM